MVGISKNIEVASNKKMTFSNFMSSDIAKRKITEVIGGKDGQRFITSLVAAVANNPNISECEHFTILSAAMQGEALKLSPSPQMGHYYLVPYKDKNRGKIATFQLGYKGYLQLAIRSGQYRDIDVIEIREGEFKGLDRRTGRPQVEFIEDTAARESLPTIGYFAFFEMLNGFTKSMFWSREKMEKHADKYSAAFNLDSYNKIKEGKISKDDMWKYSSYWYKYFDGMAFKTMLRQLISRWGIMSIEMQQAFERDNSLIKEDGSFEYIYNDTGEILDVKPQENIIEVESIKEESMPTDDGGFFEN